MCFDKIKNLLAKIDSSSFEIAVWNMVGSLLAVGIPTFIDPLLKHHVTYGPRTYSHWVLLISLLVFFLTLILNTQKNFSPKKKAVLTICAILLPTWATLPFFRQEFPHMNVLLTPIWFGLISAGVVILRGYEIDFSFLKNSNISYQTKLERLKLEYHFWFKLYVPLLATYGLFVISIAMQMSKNNEIITSEPSEIFLLQRAFGTMLILNAIWFLKGILIEIITKIINIKNNFSQLE